MAPTGEEIRANLTRFVARWSVREGNERGEAQTFLTELFECYGQRLTDVAKFEHFQSGGFVDLMWERVCIIEMKSASEAGRLASHRAQAMAYWSKAADTERNVPAPEYVVLCAFTRFEVWEPGRYPAEPRIVFELEDLPDRYTSLLFLAGDEPHFEARQEAVTIEAVKKLEELFMALDERGEGEPDVRRRFILQAVWCMFAEDLAQIPALGFTRIVDDLIANPRRSSSDDLGLLFKHLNDPSPARPQTGLYANVPFANGSLFSEPARIDLSPVELTLLREAATFNWRQVQPSIFGSLLQSVFGRERQWQLGAHYTHEADIQKIVTPSIVRPWTERIAGLDSFKAARQAQADLMRYVVLDPACGSGNFLYVAYRELRRIEVALGRRVEELARSEGRVDQGAFSAFFPLQNMRGIELEQFGVDLARVTLWMGHRLAVEELDLDERTLPLEDLSGIGRADALAVDWPSASVIVGNPPFHGDRYVRGILGDDYVEWLKESFGIGVKDYCVYWFRKAHDHLEEGQRAGLVGTNSVAQNRARGVSLDYILENDGVITDAIRTQDWPGEANVDVSIVNWIKHPLADVSPILNGESMNERIVGSLFPESLAVDTAERLPANEGVAFYGPIPGGRGFVLEEVEAKELLAKHGDSWKDVIRPYLTGDDILNRPDHSASRFIIDFAFRSLEEARDFGEALDIVRTRVKPQRDQVRRRTYRENWWRFSEPIRKMREALAGLDHYIAAPAQGKRILFVWVDAWTCPSNLTTVFALDTDYAIGVLNSSIHNAWTLAQASTLEDRTRYTASSTFDTFPWPNPDAEQRADIEEAARLLVQRRDSLCKETGTGLTDLYNVLDEGGYRDLSAMHTALDVAVAAAYGWPTGTSADGDEINRRLLRLNREIAAGQLEYAGPSEIGDASR